MNHAAEVDRLIELVREATRAQASGCATARQIKELNKRVDLARTRVIGLTDG